MKPLVCMVTDRQRFGAGAEDLLVHRVAAAARAGVHLVQVRERDLEGAALVRLVERCVSAVRSTFTRVIVNDRVDVALAAGAHGVHLRSDSMPAARVRAAVPQGFVIGRSVHAAGEAVRVSADGGVDYLIFGTVFPSASKPGLPASGAAALAEVVAATALPVLAIGGVTARTARLVAETGAAGIAAIGLFSDGASQEISSTVAEVVSAFDTPRPVP